ncbi:MAG: hypothetical protein LBG59_00560 [Candidatus Peribacteria bacterium]|jgi:hypothetical protein|nr:hypothetical protein [Candidatus Peribacteria bacterium]
MEFIIGTASVYGFMKVGQMVGSNLSAFANKHPGGTVDKMLKVIKP